jgi:uroporphyrinogen-III synthase
LAAKGWGVEVVEAYRTITPDLDPARVAAAAAADAITFTSGSTVTGFLAAAGGAGVPPVVVTIGPKTTGAATAAGLVVTAEAETATVAALAEAVVAALSTPGPAP